MTTVYLVRTYIIHCRLLFYLPLAPQLSVDTFGREQCRTTTLVNMSRPNY